MIAAAGIAMGGVSAQAADLGGNCCADLEERVAELEATTARKGNRKVSLQVYGQVSEAIIWWNDGAERNVYVLENNAIQNRLGVQGSAKINSDWSAGYKLELQVRAYRSSAANQLSLGASNGVTFAAYNTQAVAIREANWFLQSRTYGTVTVGRTAQASSGTASISLVNPDGFAGPNAGQITGGYLLRRSGTTGNAGLSAASWQNFAFIRSGDGPISFDHATSGSIVKYTSPFLLGHTKSSGFQFSADWGMDDQYSVALRYAEEFGTFRMAAGIGYQNSTNPNSQMCSTGASGNTTTAGQPTFSGTSPSTDLGSSQRCEMLTASGSLMHVPTGLYVSGGWGQIDDDNAEAAFNARTTNRQGGVSGSHSMWWVQAGWQTRLHSLGNTIFWAQYQEFSLGGGTVNSIVQTLASNDALVTSTGQALGTSIVRSTSTQVVGGGISQNIDAAAMTLYAGFYNFSTEGILGATASTARGKTNVDDMQLFYTGATIRF
jgi:hypothetical protein